MFCFSVISFAQDNKLVDLSKQLIEAKTNEEAALALEELKDIYFRDNKYNEFVDFLNSLAKQKNTLEPVVNYYIGLSRYYQLKHLEQSQGWDEYFNQGNAYRSQITSAIKNAIDATTLKDSLNIYSRLLLWQFHKDEQDAFAETALTELMGSILEYAKFAKEIKPIKEVADKLLIYGEKGNSKKLYQVYADRIVTASIKDDELRNYGLGFYKDGNLELAQTLYDVYLERVAKSTPKEKLIPILIDIAKLFAYKEEGARDMLYAEKIFQRIQELGGREAFAQELMYLRAFNLEKAKEYAKAKDFYIELTKLYPQAPYADEANFKVGIINTYILRDKKEGRDYFTKLAQREKDLSPQVISSLYQLGLLSQWEEDVTSAKDYYNQLIEKAGGDFQETATLARQRLKEIEEAEPIEYNLKIFLDVSFKEEYSSLDMTKIDLRAEPYQAKKDEVVSINSTAYVAQSGCMQVELEYLWSGELGTNKPSPKQSAFNTSYISSGTKEINLVVVSPSGVIDRSLELVDVD